jgi:hypothetical protein
MANKPIKKRVKKKINLGFFHLVVKVVKNCEEVLYDDFFGVFSSISD